MDGLRVKVQYPGMKKLCNGCYGNHLRKDCNNEKLPWADYVRNFKDHNPEIPDEFYGKWFKKARIRVLECPTEKQFHLPSCKAEWEELKSTMIGCGIEESKINSIMQERLENYEQAMREFKENQKAIDIDSN